MDQLFLDVGEAWSQASLRVRRWDTGRTLEFVLTENGAPFPIPQGCSAEFVCKKPDGTVLKNGCTRLDNTFFYEMTMRTTAQVGTLDCELRLSDGLGKLITCPRFTLIVDATIYDYGDAVESEIVNANTLKSANPGYAEVYMWSDGNPDGIDRMGCFVQADTDHDAAMVRLCTENGDVMGVCVSAPGFAANAPGGRFDENGKLDPRFCYVATMGFAQVTDNGSCCVGGKCKPDSSGCAMAAEDGFLVAERLDDTHVLILLKQDGALLVKTAAQIREKLGEVRKSFAASVGTVWSGAAAPFSQIISVPGLLESDCPVVDMTASADFSAAEKQIEAFGLIYKILTGNDQITVYASEKTTIAIPLRLEVLRL